MDASCKIGRVSLTNAAIQRRSLRAGVTRNGKIEGMRVLRRAGRRWFGPVVALSCSLVFGWACTGSAGREPHAAPRSDAAIVNIAEPAAAPDELQGSELQSNDAGSPLERQPLDTEPGTGIAECEDYLNKFERCVREKLPAAAREQLTQSVNAIRKTWREAAGKPENRDALTKGCKQALQTAKVALDA